MNNGLPLQMTWSMPTAAPRWIEGEPGKVFEQAPAVYRLSADQRRFFDPVDFSVPNPKDQSRILVAEAQSGRMYRVEAHPELFLTFSSLAPDDPAQIADFVGKYGLLGLRGEPVNHPGHGGETSVDWFDAIDDMRFAVNVANIVNGKDPPEGDAFHKFKKSFIEDFIFDIDDNKWKLKHAKEKNVVFTYHGRFSYTDFGHSPVPQLTAARIALASFATAHLWPGRIALHANNETLGWEYTTSAASLIGAMWVQFVNYLTSGDDARRCAFCSKWFLVRPKDRRTYCSDSCKLKDYRKRKAAKGTKG